MGELISGWAYNRYKKKKMFLNGLIRNKLRLTKSIIKKHFPLDGL